MLDCMDLETLIGKRLAVGIPGAEATEDVIEALRAIRAGSLVLFSRNAASPEQLRRLLRRLEEGLGYPLWVMVDHEGGRIIRFAEGVTRFPSALTVGTTMSVADAETQGCVEATELRALGVHVNLAPCVDVLVEGADPIIGDRSYGADPERVSAYAAARIRGLQTHGVAACAKHFPGLGAVNRDPHGALPTITADWNAMEPHLVPFERSIMAGVAMVMSSHACYPHLGDPPGLPATFSRRLIHDLLRRRLGFEGVMLTDDLEMGALRSFGAMDELAIRATEAGHDLLLICSDLAAAQRAAAGLRSAYASGCLDGDELERSVQRIQQARQKFLS
ncbi:MAG: beta-N-acetylhexosaminidase [Candidatus Omnitrophica bacterium]|nr:beta-N-acetylhexosaminidase [Candidatus Omnitrophota bacterium]